MLLSEWQHDQKKDKIKEAWTTLNDLFRYGLDYVQMADSAFNWFWEKRRFKEILAILRRQNLIG